MLINFLLFLSLLLSLSLSLPIKITNTILINIYLLFKREKELRNIKHNYYSSHTE